MRMLSRLLAVAAVITLAAGTAASVAQRAGTKKPAPSKVAAKSAAHVVLKTDEAKLRVDVTIDGKPFTSFQWPTTLKKPVLYPLVDATGVTVSRGWPLEPRAGERTDHPHHDGLWFNYGNANGFDFWNNSDAIKPENREKMGSVTMDKIVTAKSGAQQGVLETESTWITGKGQNILKQTTKYLFSQKSDVRVIDMTITLKALDKVVFNDDKEGVLGMRVARWLESPDEKGGTFTDANGVATSVAAVTTLPGVAPPTGEYLTSEGIKGGKVWATRGRWCVLTGHTGEHVDSIAIFDYPKNPGYPTYWHARGYGLFAANPLGRNIFDSKQEPFKFTLEKGASATFHYRVEIAAHAVTPAELNKEADAFAAK
ncbi:MAG: PmoA family protein [Terracidiphilus sp.]|nr:PmoA family protein [Terracidiphilus sp.]